MADLAERITAAINHAERIAQAAAYGPWRAKGQLVVFGQAEDHTVGVIASTLDTFDSQGASAAHIALNDPAAVLRRCAADRRVLERHTCVEDEICSGPCSYWGTQYMRHMRWPCPEIRDLADRYGIAATDTETGPAAIPRGLSGAGEHG